MRPDAIPGPIGSPKINPWMANDGRPLIGFA